MKKEFDWDYASEMLDTVCKVYCEIGTHGLLALTITILPLRDRLRKQEKTEELYNEIMEAYYSL